MPLIIFTFLKKQLFPRKTHQPTFPSITASALSRDTCNVPSREHEVLDAEADRIGPLGATVREPAGASWCQLVHEKLSLNVNCALLV